MTLLLLCTAIIAILVAGVAATCATVPEKRWMWTSPLWAAPLFLTLMFGFRMWMVPDGSDALDPGGQTHFNIACLLTLVWLPSALLGWTVVSHFVRRGE